MNIDKQQILELLRSQGKSDQAQQADSELPEQVDTDQHAGLLQKLGINMDGHLLGGAAGGISRQDRALAERAQPTGATDESQSALWLHWR